MESLTQPEITAKYEVLDIICSGSYADVYLGRRISDGVTVALKEVYDHKSASREIKALKLLQGSENVVVMHEYFWREDENAVLVLEFLRTDLAAVIKEATRGGGGGGGGGGGRMGISVGEVKRWMIQALHAIHVCHMNKIVHRDLKPGNFLISDDGVLKLADFGQAMILVEPDASNGQKSNQTEFENLDKGTINHDEYFRVLDELKIKSHAYDTDKDTNTYDGNNSCLATYATSDLDDDDPLKGSFTYEPAEGVAVGPLASRFRAPELLYGSANYGIEVDLWSLGCIFAELLALKPLFPGIGDIDQIGRIIRVLGNLNEDAWPGCSNLPGYAMNWFTKVEKPTGLEACMPNCSDDEVSLVKRLVCYDPAERATAMELLHDKYFREEPLPVPVSQLWVPFGNGQSGYSLGGFHGTSFSCFSIVSSFWESTNWGFPWRVWL